MNVTACEKILSSLPHRGPMLLVERIVEQNETSIVCEKTFRPDEYFFQGHYPDYPICPGVILCECGVQAGAILLAEMIESNDQVPVLTKLENVRFKHMVRPGDTIQMRVKFDEQLSNAFYMSAQVKCDGKTAARFSFVCSTAQKAT